MIKIEDGKVEISDSCGCLFCDLGSKPQLFDGKPAHIQADYRVFLCTKDTDLSTKRMQ